MDRRPALDSVARFVADRLGPAPKRRPSFSPSNILSFRFLERTGRRTMAEKIFRGVERSGEKVAESISRRAGRMHRSGDDKSDDARPITGLPSARRFPIQLENGLDLGRFNDVVTFLPIVDRILPIPSLVTARNLLEFLEPRTLESERETSGK